MRVFLLLYLCILLRINCKATTEECHRSNCNYNGICIRSPQDNSTRCICIYGYSGPRCETVKCRCLNGGKCRQLSSRTVCDCPSGYIGQQCETLQPKLHICSNAKVCGPNGRCVPNSKEYKDFHCECNRGFEDCNLKSEGNVQQSGKMCEIMRNCRLFDDVTDNTVVSAVDSVAIGDRCQNCSAGFTGDNCEFETNECLRKPCARGRCISRGDSYRCECPQGFEGKNCELSIDPCYGALCENDAECVAVEDTYFCNCKPGYTGRYCDYHIANCSNGYCKNGGKCFSTVYGNSCLCPAGFTGSLCEREIDICGYNLAICQNGGTCINSDNKYYCICVSGWEGKNCEMNVDDCKDSLCAEGSKCIDRVASYICECPVGRTGTFCNLTDPCLSNPCKEGSECLVNSETGEYQCKCQNGFTGRDCSVDIDECVTLNITCGNNGTCVNTRGSWRCECDEGFSGAFCATSVERCSPNPCLNGGSCLDYRKRGECVCIPGFYGEYCDKKCPDGYVGKNCEILKCNSSTCLNNGLCVNGICRCPPQFTGDRCQTAVSNPCETNPCGRNEVCKLSANGIDYICECEMGFFGVNCQEKFTNCVLNPCQHGGKCEDKLSGYICSCQPGYSGKNCEINDDDCKNNPCLNGGTCIDGVNSFACHCPEHLTGNHCEKQITNPCRNNLCRNNATCYSTLDSEGYKCECPSGFSGKYCEQDVDECKTGSSSICKNGGTCKNTYGSYDCICGVGFTGKTCEQKAISCQPNSCMNGGHCVETYGGGFRCGCLTGFTGLRCETNIDDCANARCQNGGTCYDQINGFGCHCKLGFSGRWCENNDEDCYPGLCLNNGTCVDGVNSYHCECQKGYTGKNCQVKVNFEEYIRTDMIDKESCKKLQCEQKSGNGHCDQECNLYACNYDGGDCSAKMQPFQRCEFASFCAHNFHNDRCDEMCNSEMCLFDGYDCDSTSDRCYKRNFCAEVFGDGKCDPECNNRGCGWDGGDCNQSKSSKALNGDVVLVLLISPQEFINHMRPFLLTLSQTLRASVSIKMENQKPQIYEWDSVNGIGARVEVSKEHLTELSAGRVRAKREDGKITGCMVVLLVDTLFCHEDDRLNCFSDIASVAGYLGAAAAKQLIPDLNMKLYSATAELASENKMEGIPNSVFVSFLFAFAFVGVLFLMVQQGRKRRILNAPIWRPPLNESGKSSSTDIDTFTIQSGFHYSEFGSAKRMRTDHRSDVFIAEDTQSFLSHNLEKCHEDERQWTALHEEAMLKMPIATPVKPSLVNAKGKYGRTPLMLVILNESKDESTVQEDIDTLLAAGGEIDLADDEETTPLMCAVKKARLSVVKYLLKKGANASLADSQHRTVLHHAVAIDYPDMVHELLGTDVNVNAWDCNNQTALVYAARFAFQPCIAEELLQANADPSCTGDKSSIDHNGRTALHFAAQCNNLEVIQVLINHGANKDAQDQQEQTPLFLAALEGKFNAVKLLISLGATKDICDQKERSPRDIAAERKYHDIVTFLDAVCTQRALPANFSGNGVTFGGQLVRQKKSAKKPNSKPVKKLLNTTIPSNNALHSNVNPLTPPLSDGSNYSTTPSPNDVHSSARGTTHVGLFDSSLQTSSVMLSPQFETCNPTGWSPQENSSFVANGTGAWTRIDFPYDERCFITNDQAVTPYQYQYSHVQHSTGYCNV